MEIIYVLAFIALIAVIFGVSMHEAFWGIIGFIVLALLAGTILFFLKMLKIRTENKAKYYKTEQGKKEIAKKKNDFVNNLIEAFVLLIIFSPLLLEALFHTLLKDFTAQNGLAVLIISLAPISVLIATYFVHYIKSNQSKKHTGK